MRPPRVAASPCALECRLLEIIPLKDLEGRPVARTVVFGQVVGIHIDDRFINNGRLDTAAMQPIARCGYADYSVVDKVFAMAWPQSFTLFGCSHAMLRTLAPFRARGA